ncbi:fumarylacetoacetase [Catalinimonas alkaloidigena]|uniref:fumarylacetoacetase n=1 Tax=Catalinimonas alkaloidigena TaxID=1075417 RepID=UPI002405BEA2|nr:fumarylacetoacetase [Catalinimonas alkaloidigena]MDF9800879.1 fumarylacetoacetase [Catalinimonas alkaloidigena]
MPQSPWLNITDNSDFSIYNLPYGVFSTATRRPRVGVAIGEYIIDMAAVAGRGKFHDLKVPLEVFEASSLNAFMHLGRARWKAVRQRLIQWVSQENSPLEQLKGECLIRQSEARMHLPVQIGDYTDFYASEEHATNVGTMFRGKENALVSNWKHMPIAYHGRASSIVISATDIHRPKGQIMPKDAETPAFAASQKLDFELEMAAVIGKDSELGHPVLTEEAEDHIFGFVLFNDWSARDIQRWEYVPLGPFLGKNFASSISPWIVPLEALQAFQTDGPEQHPVPLPYLQKNNPRNFDIQLEVSLQPEQGEKQIISRTNFKHMYWSIHQQIAHHTVNGCNLRVGDLLASGTISGKATGSQGSMLELSWNGEQPLQMNSGIHRSFVEDGDTICMTGFARKENIHIGFGEVKTKILPAL